MTCRCAPLRLRDVIRDCERLDGAQGQASQMKDDLGDEEPAVWYRGQRTSPLQRLEWESRTRACVAALRVAQWHCNAETLIRGRS